MTIKPRPGDVLDEPPGAIFAEAGVIVRSGVVIIHRSRLRRAKRFGWIESPNYPPAHQVAPHLIAVARA